MMKEFEKIIGYEGIKEELELICDVVKNYDKYEQLGVSFPGGIMLEDLIKKSICICRKGRMQKRL